jgi:hypothetical protein
MKKNKYKQQKLSLYLDERSVKEIERLGKKVGVSRCKMAGNLLASALDDAKVFDSVGLLRLAIKMREAADQVQGVLESVPHQRGVMA